MVLCVFRYLSISQHLDIWLVLPSKLTKYIQLLLQQYIGGVLLQPMKLLDDFLLIKFRIMMLKQLISYEKTPRHWIISLSVLFFLSAPEIKCENQHLLKCIMFCWLFDFIIRCIFLRTTI